PQDECHRVHALLTAGYDRGFDGGRTPGCGGSSNADDRPHQVATPPHLWTLLCVVKALKQPEETAGEVALKAAPDLSAGFAFGRASSDVVLGLRVEAGATDSDHVQGSVQAPVALPV